MRHRDDAKEIAIVEAAIKLINENGFAETSISRIAKEAGVSPATIYIYFESKEDLINKLYLYVKEQMVDAISFRHGSADDWQQSFNRLLAATGAYLARNSELLSFMDQCMSNPAIQEATMEEGMKLFAPVFRFFEEGMTAGVFKRIDQQVLSSLVFIPIYSLVRTAHQHQEPLSPEHLAQLQACAWDAIRA